MTGGLYNVVLGTRPESSLLLQLLTNSTTQAFEVGRFRDAWVERSGDWLDIRVHTRNGGGNRRDQAKAIASMRAHPWYERDSDEVYDVSYASFWFRVPVERLRTELPKWEWWLRSVAQEPVDVGARWREAIESLGGLGGETP